MNDLELSRLLYTGNSIVQELTAGRTRTYTGVALSDSRDGHVIVDMGGSNVSSDGTQGVEIPCTQSVKNGEKILITVVNGSPVVTGSIGWGDAIEKDIDNAGKTATNYMDFTKGTGLIIGDLTEGDLGGNVNVTSDSVRIRKGEQDLVVTEAVEKTENAVAFGYVGINYPASSVIDATFNNGYTSLESTYNVHGQELFNSSGDVRTKLAYKKAKTSLIDVINNGLEVYDETNELALFFGLSQVSTDVSTMLQSLMQLAAYISEGFSLNIFKNGLVVNSLDLGVDANGHPTVDILAPKQWRDALGFDDAIITREYEYGSIDMSAGTIGTRFGQVQKSVTVDGYTPIGVSITYVNGSDSIHPIAFFNASKTVLYMNVYRATSSAYSKSTNVFTAEVVYIKTSLL